MPGKGPVLPPDRFSCSRYLALFSCPLALHIQHLDAAWILCHPSLPANTSHTDHWAEAGMPLPSWPPSTLGMVKVKALWLSPAFLLYPLVTIVLQSYFMHMWRQDQPLHFHLTYFHFISTYWFDWMSLSTPCSAALPFIPAHKQHIDCCLFSSPSWLLFSCCNEGGFSSTFSYNCLFTSVICAWKNEPFSS